jgi:hypothetical protein
MSAATATVQDAEKPRKSRSLASPVQSKPRLPIIGAAIALIIVMALLFVWILQSQGRSETVFAVKGDIARGHIFEVDDLTAVQIPEGEPIPHFLTTQQGDVIGKTAVVDIPAGSLVVPKAISSGAGLPDDQSLVGMSLNNSQLPPYPLTNGDKVRIVSTPANQAEVPKETPQAVSASVVSTEKDTVSGQTLVAVMVPKADAPILAAKAATGRVALILDGDK